MRLLNKICLGLYILIASVVIFTGSLRVAHAKSDLILNGIIVGVETDEEERLTKFAISDSSGVVTTFEVASTTQYGLENQAGDRWVSNQLDDPVEAARRLRDHRRRFAPVTVSASDGVANSVVERHEGKLETNLGYLFSVFTVTWALFFGYVFYMSRKQRVLQHEIARLKKSSE